MEPLLVEFLLSLDTQEHQLGALEFRAVEHLLFAFHLANQLFLDAIGKVLGNLTFGAAQQKWADTGRQTAARKRILLRLVTTREVRAIAEHTGHSEGKNAPEIEQSIFDRRAGQRETMFGLKRARDLRGLRIGVFDILRLVENCDLPGMLRNVRTETA